MQNKNQNQNQKPKDKHRLGDRHDGKKLRNSDPFFKLMPYIMRTRMDSQVYFEEAVEIDELEKYVRAKRAGDIPGLRMVHVFAAAALRMFARNPALNRFVAGKNIYARNHFRLSMAVKRSMTFDAEETIITPYFELDDTIYDVVKKLETEFANTFDSGGSTQNKTDDFAGILKKTPGFLIRFVAFFARNLDKTGLMPKAIFDASPFHSSLFITDVGSIGIDAIYHHIYEFGTTSIFMAMGKKEPKLVMDGQGNVAQKKTITLRFVLDERICDGFYYASAIRQMKRLLKKPHLLEQKPGEEDVCSDPWI